MHATIFGQISPEFPFVTLGAQTETGYIFNEAVSGGHSRSSSTTTTLCCRLVTISACSWWSEKKTIRWADFPRENPPMNVSVHLLMQHVATLPHLCRLRVQFVAFDTSNMLFSPTPPPIETPWMWRTFMLIVCFSQTGLRWWSNSRLSSHQWEHSKEVSLTVTFMLTLYYQLNILCPVPTIH